MELDTGDIPGTDDQIWERSDSGQLWTFMILDTNEDEYSDVGWLRCGYEVGLQPAPDVACVHVILPRDPHT